MTFTGVNNNFFAVVTPRQRALGAILRIRVEGRPFETHNSLTWSWRHLPLTLTPIIWFDYYRELQGALLSMGSHRGTGLFIRGTVLLPFLTIPSDFIRNVVYELFYFNTPRQVRDFVVGIRFRLFFIGTTLIEDRMVIQNLRVTTEYSDPFYYDYYNEQ